MPVEDRLDPVAAHLAEERGEKLFGRGHLPLPRATSKETIGDDGQVVVELVRHHLADASPSALTCAASSSCCILLAFRSLDASLGELEAALVGSRRAQLGLVVERCRKKRVLARPPAS